MRDAFDAEEQAVVHANFPTEGRTMMIDGWVTATKSGAMSAEAFEEAIEGMVRSGVVTSSEAAAARVAVANE
ncbi:MAG: hypothetical protein ACRDWD_09385 [Acidimicrobiia bacterium]